MKGLIDSTLREGEQSAGINYTLAQKIEIVRLLDRLGIEEIELGVGTSWNTELSDLIRMARDTISRSRLALWCRCRREDIEFSAKLRPDVISLSIPASDIHIKHKLGKDRVWVLTCLRLAILRARELGVGIVSVGFEDATRADRAFLQQLALVAVNAGADRLRIADTVGIATPSGLADLVRHLSERWPVEFAVHTHNDFGMATANALSAIDAGADWADVTVLGLGERAGNARLEEVVGYLALRLHKNSYRIDQLRPLCETTAIASGVFISSRHPIVGQEIFSCESGLHLHGLIRDPETYEPFAPEKVGAKRDLRIGSKTGRRAVADQLSRLGITAHGETLAEIVFQVRNRSRILGRPLSSGEIAQIAREFVIATEGKRRYS